jgi:E3 ubiquitin-protein ligase TRIP12
MDSTIDLVCQDFASLIIPFLSSPALSMARESFAASLIWQCPFIFPLSHRLLFVQASAFDIPVSVKALNKRFLYSSQPVEFETVIHVAIDRNTLFDDGLVLLDRLGQGPARFEIELENGIGSGPTQEFFTLFSRELCRTSRGMWRSTDNSGEFVTPGNGLFPRPDAPANLFFILGILCAKALTTGYRIEISIHPRFFDVANDVSDRAAICEEVDPEFTHNLAEAKGAADFHFVFPGTEIELIPNGREVRVDSTNWTKFVDRVLEVMLCKPLAEEFKRGFNRVLPWKAMTVFTGSEIAFLFRGSQPTKLIFEELRAAVQPSHGYEMDSPQIQWLFQTLLEFEREQIEDFLQFATGARLLPIGGFAACKLTVAKATDKGRDALPTVMTCSRYLKIPAYPTKNVLKEKLLQAITDGRNGFDKT